MGKISHVVFIKGEEVNCGYASEQIALELEKYEIDTYFVDYQNLIETMAGLCSFAVKGETALVTFNFIGLSEEIHFFGKDCRYIWQDYEMQYLNLLMEHPMFFDKQLRNAPENMVLFCADMGHVKYVERFYPNVRVFFLAAAGNVKADINLEFLKHMPDSAAYGVKYRDYDRIWDYEDTLKPIDERRMDVVFTGNYVPLQNFITSIGSKDRRYEDELYEVLDDMQANPKQSFEHVLMRHVTRRQGELPDEKMRTALGDMSIIHLCIRTMLRDEILRKLAEADIKVHVFGEGWDTFECGSPQNFIYNTTAVSPADCVKAVQEAKISLNVMPLAADGAHERVFTAMLQKAVALTDHSSYLDERFKDDLELVYYDTGNPDGIIDTVYDLLKRPDRMQQIADTGFQKAISKHTWRQRADELMKFLQEPVL